MNGRIGSVGSVVSANTKAGTVGDIDRKMLAVPAVLVMGALFGSRLAINGPVPTPFDLVALHAFLLPFSTIISTGSLIGIAVSTGDPYEAVGLAFAGVFGAIGTFVRPAFVPAVIGVVGGTTIVLAHRQQDIQNGQALVVAILICGIGSSLIGVAGIEPAVSRPLGSKMTLLGISGTPIFVDRRRLEWLAGAFGCGLVGALGVIAPFRLGASSLVAGGIVGVSLPLMAVAIGGLTMTASGAVRSRQYAGILAAGILLFAGVPSTIPRALGVVLALTLLVDRSSGGVARART